MAIEPVNAAEAAKAADLCYAVTLQAKTSSNGKLLSCENITFNLNGKQQGMKSENIAVDKKSQTADNKFSYSEKSKIVCFICRLPDHKKSSVATGEKASQ